MAISCSYVAACSGCEWILKDSLKIRDFMINSFIKRLGIKSDVPVDWIDGGDESILKKYPGGTRDRVDLTISNSAIGLLNFLRDEILDVQGCPQMSEALENWYKDFRILKPNVRKGSVRLRVDPSGKRGVWLDFANLDVKSLLEERRCLELLLDNAVVEIGQRRKVLKRDDNGNLKLGDPILLPWFETYSFSQDLNEPPIPIPLFCNIASFTQPGFKGNFSLIKEVVRRARECKPQSIVEFGSGIGNFTLALAQQCEQIDAYEVDALANEGLKKALSANEGIASRVKVNTGNFHSGKQGPEVLRNKSMVLVDPPRSGLMDFLNPVRELANHEKPQFIVYVSCYQESFALDVEKLRSFGYEIQSASLLNLFPKSPHCEIIATLQLVSHSKD